MAPNIVSSVLHAAPGAFNSYRKNRGVERTRRGDNYLFEAVQLVDGIRDLLDVDAIGGFTVRYNG